MTPWTVAHPSPLSMGNLEILEWVVMPSFRGSSQPRDQTQVSHIAGGFITSLATREAFPKAGSHQKQDLGSFKLRVDAYM